MGDRDRDGFGSVVLVLDSSSGNSIGWRINWAIGSLIGRSESSINWGFYGILTFWEISWELNHKIFLGKGLFLVASPLGYDWGIVSMQIDTTVESSSPSYKRAY